MPIVVVPEANWTDESDVQFWNALLPTVTTVPGISKVPSTEQPLKALAESVANFDPTLASPNLTHPSKADAPMLVTLVITTLLRAVVEANALALTVVIPVPVNSTSPEPVNALEPTVLYAAGTDSAVRDVHPRNIPSGIFLLTPSGILTSQSDVHP